MAPRRAFAKSCLESTSPASKDVAVPLLHFHELWGPPSVVATKPIQGLVNEEPRAQGDSTTTELKDHLASVCRACISAHGIIAKSSIAQDLGRRDREPKDSVSSSSDFIKLGRLTESLTGMFRTTWTHFELLSKNMASTLLATGQIFSIGVRGSRKRI